MTTRRQILSPAWLALATLAATGLVFIGPLQGAPGAGGKVIASWQFDEGTGDTVSGAADGSASGKIVGARWAEGKTGGALEFEDWSVLDYVHPDVKKATRVVVSDSGKLDPAGPFSIKAVIYPTRDPVYYGGIIEKGRGYEAAYRLLVLRGSKIRAIVGTPTLSVTSPDPVSLNAWHEIEMTYDGSALTLSIDGRAAGRAEGKRTAPSSKDDVVIGERFSGKIDSIELSAR